MSRPAVTVAVAERSRDARAGAEPALPVVSIVIPIRNEASSIAGCLDAIRAQNYPPDRLEVLVVDGASTDDSVAIVRARAAADPRIRLLHNATGLIPVGLNIGIRAARGDVFARVDARARLQPDYFATAVRLLRETGADNVGGAVRSVSPGYTARVLAAAVASRFGIGGAAVRYRDGAQRDVDTVYLGVYPRRVLERIGLYDEEMVRDQDDELNFRLREHGGRVVLSPRLVSTYLNSGSLRRFLRQQFLYGYFKVRVCQKHPRMMSVRHWVPPAFTLGLLAGPPAAIVSSTAAQVLGGVLGIYLLCAVTASAAEARRAGVRCAAPLPVVFLLLHATWGLGFLAGLVRFLPRWFRTEAQPPALSPRGVSS